MHADDLGKATLFALKYWDPSANNAPLDEQGNVLLHLNVGAGKDISIRALAEKIADALNYKGEIRWDLSKPDGTPRKNLDIKKLSSLGWTAEISLDEGIKRTIKELTA